MLTPPLEGIKVVECGFWIQGPSAAMTLGMLGADVIKIEERLTGDPARGFSPFFAIREQRIERNYLFECENLNKRSISLDLRKKRAQEVLHRIIEEADIFIHNFSQDAPKRLGIDYDSLSAVNPRLIYGQASGWGPKGILSSQPAYDGMALGRSGFMYLIGEQDMPPQVISPGLGDELGAMTLVTGILLALLVREREGYGQLVDVSLIGSLIALEKAALSSKLMLGLEPPRVPRKRLNPLYNHYKCSDNKWLFLSMQQGNRHWPSLCKAMVIERLENDPRFENIYARIQHSEELVSILDEIFATKTRTEWIEHFKRMSNELVSPIQTISEVVEDPQILANEYIVNYNHPKYGSGKAIGLPYKFSKSGETIVSPPPEFGQHTEEVLLDIGYTWDDIAQLKKEEVI